ncbi:MAG: hypothetical protein ACI8T1_004380 [Verrucomicrobiales bacterium]|jgi:hypothetical protein
MGTREMHQSIMNQIHLRPECPAGPIALPGGVRYRSSKVGSKASVWTFRSDDSHFHLLGKRLPFFGRKATQGGLMWLSPLTFVAARWGRFSDLCESPFFALDDWRPMNSVPLFLSRALSLRRRSVVYLPLVDLLLLGKFLIGRDRVIREFLRCSRKSLVVRHG